MLVSGWKYEKIVSFEKIRRGDTADIRIVTRESSEIDREILDG